MLSPAAKGNLYLHKEGGVVIHVAFTFSTTLLVNFPFLRLPAALREQATLFSNDLLWLVHSYHQDSC